MGAQVLIVDFEPGSAAATRALLEAAGVEVVVAGSTKELEPFLTREPPPIVVLEPMLPGVDGFRFIRALKTRGPRGPLVVAASRIFKGPRYRVMAQEAGADQVLERPQDDALLVESVEQVLTGGNLPAVPVRPAVTATVAPSAARTVEPEPDPFELEPFAAPQAPAKPAVAAANPSRTALAPGTVVPAATALDPELDQLVDRMFESFLETDESRPVAPPPATAAKPSASAPRASAVALEDPPPPAAPPRVTREMLSSLKEIESSLPTGTRGPAPGVVGRAEQPLEVETSVPLPPPPRGEDEKALDEAVLRITGVVAPASADAGKTERAQALRQYFDPQHVAPAPPKSKAPVLGAVAALLVVAAAATWYFGFRTPGAPGAAGTESAVAGAPAPPVHAPNTPPVETSPAPADSVPAAVATVPPAAVPHAGESAPPSAAAATRPPAPAASGTQPKNAPTAVAAVPAGREPQPLEPHPAPANEPAPAQAAAPPQPEVAPPAPEPSPEPVVEHKATQEPTVDVTTEPAPAPPPVPSTIEVHPEQTGPLVAGSNGVTMPQLITRVDPVYPPMAVRKQLKGTVTLQAVIGEDGRVADLKLLAEPPGSGFGRAALNAVRKWRYRPATKLGDPVASVINISVRFTP